MDIHTPDPCRNIKEVRYRFIDQYKLYSSTPPKFAVGYTDKEIYVYVHGETEVQLPDEFEGVPILVMNV